MTAITCELLSINKPKPKELKGVKQARIMGKPANIMFSGTKGAWKLFVKGDDLFIQATDFFSPSIHELSRKDRVEKINSGSISLEEKNKLLRVGESDINGLGKHYGIDIWRQKFTYSDNWGYIVAKVQAWLVFRGVMRFSGRFIDLVQEVAKGIGVITGISAIDIQLYHNTLVSGIAEAIYMEKLKW